MTMKRFTLIEVNGNIEDSCTQIVYDGGEDVFELLNLLNSLHDENEQLKLSSTMYYQLFVELQKQMKGVKKASDLDSKDFEDLIELSKGNVFDDEIGWIHLPVKELEE